MGGLVPNAVGDVDKRISLSAKDPLPVIPHSYFRVMFISSHQVFNQTRKDEGNMFVRHLRGPDESE